MRKPASPFVNGLKGRINLASIPFTDRGSRLLIFHRGQSFEIRLAERWIKWERELGEFLRRTPMIDRLSILDAEGRPMNMRLTAFPHAVAIDTAGGAFWLAFADALTGRMLDHFWDEREGLFWATKDHHPLRVLTPVSLFPLLTGRLPKSIEDRLIRHLFEKREFWTAFPIPSVAKSDPRYDPQTMWRGPTWVNINYLFIEGLERIGRLRQARRLRAKTLNMVMKNNDIYDYYHPESGKNCPKAASLFGWSSAVFVDFAIRSSCRAEESRRESS
jgi:hypothetical protein